MLNRLTKKILLGESLKVDAGASVQALYDIVSSIRVTNKRDSGRVQLAKEHIRSIKRHVRSLNERVNALEEELKVFPEMNKQGDFNVNSTSKLCFLNTDLLGEPMFDSIPVDKSFEGKMLMFSASQYHAVYPFYTSDEERITVSGNLKFKTNLD